MELGKFIVYIHRKLTGDLNQEEQGALSEWLSDEENAKAKKDFDKIWAASTNYKKVYQPDIEKSWDTFSAKMASERKAVSSLRVVNRRKLAFAATILILIVAGALWWSGEQSGKALKMVATLGGETRSITLPDASVVVLNQYSTLSYPLAWEGEPTRQVKLSGEAYFSVVPNAQQPFQIETDQTKVEVLGTAFNLRAYPDELFTEVAVTEGRVQFAGKRGKDKMVLNPNDVGRFDHGDNTIRSIPYAAINAQSWRTNNLTFRNTPIAEIAETLERHFDIDIRFENVAVSRCSYTSNFSEVPLKDVLNSLKIGLSLNIIQTGEEAYLFSGGDCGTGK